MTDTTNGNETNTGDVFLTLYLSLFYTAWKRGYKLYWILLQLTAALYSDEDEKAGFESFRAHATENNFPLFLQAEYWGHTAPYLLATTNKKFSDWMFDKNPSQEKFIETVMKHRDKLLVTPEKMGIAQCVSSRDLQARRWEALDSLGGQVANLRAGQLVYLSMGRKTGRDAGAEINTLPSVRKRKNP